MEKCIRCKQTKELWKVDEIGCLSYEVSNQIAMAENGLCEDCVNTIVGVHKTRQALIKAE